ncbi:MAG: response regulator [Elusimicrobia bacterium]|nr:response regulator [Elusimicrobiota bacterium]
MPLRPVVLLVEDDPDDAFLLQDACKRLGHEEMLRVVRDGEEAIAYLLGQGAFADRLRFPLPRLILLDLKLPRISGLEVLDWRRGQGRLKNIPVIVLTASQSDADIARAYELGANSYLVKPVDSTAQLAMVKAACAYWIELNRTPSSAPGA